jgi:hypothetical protein
MYISIRPLKRLVSESFVGEKMVVFGGDQSLNLWPPPYSPALGGERIGA